VTLLFATQTRFRRLNLNMEQSFFWPFVPEFLAEFSASPEFPGSVTEKYLSTGWVRNFALQITNQILYHCTTASLYVKMLWHSLCYLLGFSGHFCSYWPGFSSRIYNYWLGISSCICSYCPGFSGRICSYRLRDFPAVSVVTSQDFPP
jgi:hypothetical protein